MINHVIFFTLEKTPYPVLSASIDEKIPEPDERKNVGVRLWSSRLDVDRDSFSFCRGVEARRARVGTGVAGVLCWNKPRRNSWKLTSPSASSSSLLKRWPSSCEDTMCVGVMGRRHCDALIVARNDRQESH